MEKRETVEKGEQAQPHSEQEETEEEAGRPE